MEREMAIGGNLHVLLAHGNLFTTYLKITTTTPRYTFSFIPFRIKLPKNQSVTLAFSNMLE